MLYLITDTTIIYAFFMPAKECRWTVGGVAGFHLSKLKTSSRQNRDISVPCFFCNKAAWLPLLHFPFHVMEQLVAPYVACLSAHSLQNGKEGSNCAYSPEATYRGAAGMHGCERGEMVHSLLDQFCVFLWISLNCRFNFMSLTLHGNLCKYTIWTPVYNIAVQENKRATV